MARTLSLALSLCLILLLVGLWPSAHDLYPDGEAGHTSDQSLEQQGRGDGVFTPRHRSDHGDDVGEPPQQLPPVYDNVYYHYWDLREHLQDIQQAHPDIVELDTIGYSVVGEDDPSGDYGHLMLARITNLADQGPKPEIYIDGGHHGNEPLGMELAVMVLEQLVENYGSDPQVTLVVDSYDIYIVPMINVDGNTYDQRSNANGVDLNRNYPFHWNGAGSGPASEPEVASNVGFFEAHDFELYISMHTGIEMFLTPWGYTADNTPDVEMYTSLAQELENLTGFESGPAGQILYAAQGTSLDYGYFMGMPSITPEVDSEQWGQFTIEEKRQRLDAVYTGTMYMLENFPLFGAYPVVSGIQYPRTLPADEPFTLKVQLENLGFGPVINGTFWLEGEGFAAGPEAQVVEYLGPGNLTTLFFQVTAGNEGDLSVQFDGRYQVMVMDNSTERTLSEQFYPTLNGTETPSPPLQLTVGEADEGLPAWVWPVGALLLVAAIGVAYVLSKKE